MTAAGHRKDLKTFEDDLRREVKSLREILRLDPSLEDGFKAWIAQRRSELGGMATD